MTTPEPKQKNTKAWVATIVSLLGNAVPIIAQVAGWLPEPYGAVLSGIGLIITALVGGGTYQANNAPKGTVLTPTPVVPGGNYDNPYRAS